MSSLADLETLRRLAFALVLAAVPLVGQCELQWQPGSPVSGVNGNVNAMVPAPGLGEVYVAGDFNAAGSNLVGNVAHWDGNSWSGLGLRFDGPVYDAVAMPNGDLVVAGWFATAGGSSAANIARWDGTSWSPVGVLFELHAPNMGEVVTSFAVPNVVALVGQSFRTQLVGLEFDALLALTGITSTNALDLTIGSY